MRCSAVSSVINRDVACRPVIADNSHVSLLCAPVVLARINRVVMLIRCPWRRSLCNCLARCVSCSENDLRVTSSTSLSIDRSRVDCNFVTATYTKLHHAFLYYEHRRDNLIRSCCENRSQSQPQQTISRIKSYH